MKSGDAPEAAQAPRQDAIEHCPWCRGPLRVTSAIGPAQVRRCRSLSCRTRRFGGFIAVVVEVST